MVGHIRDAQPSDSVRCLIRLELEERVDVYHFTTDRQEPGGLPCFIALLSLPPPTVDVMIYGWGESGESTLLAKDDVPRLYYEIDDLQRQVIVGE